VIVYAGAIVVLFLFVIMLLGVDKAESLRIDPVKVQRPLAAIVGVGLFGLIGGAIVQGRNSLPPRGVGLDKATDVSHDSNIRQLANDLFSNHVFAFEITSVLLVIAVVGTVLLSRRPRSSGATDSATNTNPVANPNAKASVK
jgi:NADH-quinone oxidoreductase subunit J